jgi:hypothetical protein
MPLPAAGYPYPQAPRRAARLRAGYERALP